MKRVLVGMTGASGATYGVDFLRKFPGEKHLVLSKWAKMVLQSECGLSESDLAPLVQATFNDQDLSAPFASGSNRHDACLLLPASASTVGKIAAGIGDTLITRAAQVALKERMRLIVCVRETPLSSIALENALKLSREGVVIMPLSPPWYDRPRDVAEVVAGFSAKLIALLGEATGGWRADELE